jgi:acyl-CoA thioester hydrolase
VTGFLWPVRIYYEDTDAGGVVYYANYLKYMERARTEYLRQHGFEQDELKRELGVIFAVRSVQVDYLLPARFNDLLHVSASIIKHGRASLTFEQDVIRQADNALLCRGEIKVASLDAANFRVCTIPESITKYINPGE